jgi:hypothetical protein
MVLLTRVRAATGRTQHDRRLAREEVLTARHDLLRVAEALRAEPPGAVRGIAEVSLLLTDGSGPLFNEHPAGTLREAAFRAAFHLEAG